MADVTVQRGQPASPASPPPGRHRQADHRKRGRVGAGVAGVAVAMGVAAAVGWVITDGSHQSVDAAVSASVVDADAADWIRSNLGPDVTFLTDGHSAPAGFASSPIDRPNQDWHAFDFLLTAPGTDPPLDGAVAVVWRASVPVSRFPGVQVRRILSTPLAETLRTHEADRADRLLAGTALLANPGVTASPQAQAGLTSGGLDLRAAATLTALAGSMPVYVANIEDVRPEAAAGLPARSMTVQVADPSKANTVISGMTSAFRADHVVATPQGTFRLHWPLRFDPLPSVN